MKSLRVPLLEPAGAVGAVSPSSALSALSCVFGNLGVLSVVVRLPTLAMLGFLLASVAVGAALLIPRVEFFVERLPKSTSHPLALAAYQGLTFVQLAVPGVWLVVSLLETQEDLKLLAGILLVVGAQAPWWFVFTLLIPHTIMQVVQAGVQQPCCWGPLAVFFVLITGVGTQPATLRGQALTGDLMSCLDEESGPSMERTRSSRIRALKGLPDWAPPTRVELQGWQDAFALHDEHLLGVYACSVTAKVHHQGRLYISFGSTHGSGHLCFRGLTILRSALEFVIQVDHVQEVKQEGDTVTVVLQKPIMMKGQRELFSSVELKVGERGTAALNAIFSRGSKSGDIGDGGSDSEPETMSLKTVGGSIPQDGPPYSTVLEATIPGIPAEVIKEEVLREAWDNCFYTELLKIMGASEIRLSSRIDDSDASAVVHVREVNFVMPVPPAPMCPKSTKVTTTARLSVQANGVPMIVLETSSISHDVPFGSNFVVQEKVVFEWKGDGSSLSLTKSTRVTFLKSVGFLKGKIQSSVMSEQAKSGNLLVGVLRSRAASGSRVDRAPTTQRNLVWEMQRRTTLFQQDWRAPFLPHDGDKRWRWVDAAYTRHHLLLENLEREDAASRAFPPFRQQPGWTALGRWEVDMKCVEEDKADKAGWQYAVDFYRRDELWGKTSTGMHCRRRLWVCDFVEEAAEST